MACEDSENKDISTKNEGDECLSNSSKLSNVLRKIKLYQSSCVDSSSDVRESSDGSDSKFESLLLACTSDDQKEIGKR